ncbi:MAG: o-succinylbenzoate synthase [Cyanobium sp. MED843]|nr:o-succinylbenzoate synthase [Cyanobium sp. MED843]OUW28069.1 MAG: o-succinylbenzoate synthase [Cyanobacteria bacterium TMED177]
MVMQLQWRAYRFVLQPPMLTASGPWSERCGWLLRLDDPQSGRLCWGEAAPGPAEHALCAAALSALPSELSAGELNDQLSTLPGPVAFAIGLALAELEGLEGDGWLPAPASAVLLPAGGDAIPALQQSLRRHEGNASAFVAKWKVGVLDCERELHVLEQLLEQLPLGAQLRLDANGGWDRVTAGRWAMRLQQEPKLQWLEQPLPPRDHAGLLALAKRLPVALDESLRDAAGVPVGWPGWLVHKPALEGDPRPLLQQLQIGAPRRMVSTALETGVGARAVAHLAALASRGPTPCAAGLAPGWGASGDLASPNPLLVWEAAGR